MSITLACAQILNQLVTLVSQIKESDFTKPCTSLGQATIGQHLRHTLEFFLSFEQGCYSGVINYDKRPHDRQLETDRRLALATLSRISAFLETLQPEKPVSLEVGYDSSGNTFVAVKSNTLRELVYNIEHAVHHMAIMKIGVREVAPYIDLPADFGVATSTLKWKRSASQTPSA